MQTQENSYSMENKQRYLAALAVISELQNSKLYNSNTKFARQLGDLEATLNKVVEPLEPFEAFLNAQFLAVVALSESQQLFGGIQQP